LIFQEMRMKTFLWVLLAGVVVSTPASHIMATPRLMPARD
jgi:hypothetical protein